MARVTPEMREDGATPAARRAAARRRALRKGQHDDIVSVLMLIAGAALFFGPWVAGQMADNARDASSNELVVGLIVVFVAGRRLSRGAGVRSDLVILLAGGWMIAAPFVLGRGDTRVNGPSTFDITVGIVLAVLALVGLGLLRAARGPGRRARHA
ncbi:SPW repeat protein [Streptomyces sp. NPDC127098]|uniref:SPW repeat domain-containing protein n=1 Tax=Streptomyces sp. NPDC127098 TaxID=3347137 RepID=UPI00365D2956